MILMSGRYYRILFRERAEEMLLPVRHYEGRFHHDGQTALYVSPDMDAARVAIDSYYKADDPPRVAVPLYLTSARLVDFRDPKTAGKFGLKGTETSVNWRQERIAGQPASSWLASDAARAAGADGMIYTSRKMPPHWHIVLFDWNSGRGARLRADGPPIPFDSSESPRMSGIRFVAPE